MPPTPWCSSSWIPRLIVLKRAGGGRKPGTAADRAGTYPLHFYYGDNKLPVWFSSCLSLQWLKAQRGNITPGSRLEASLVEDVGKHLTWKWFTRMDGTRDNSRQLKREAHGWECLQVRLGWSLSDVNHRRVEVAWFLLKKKRKDQEHKHPQPHRAAT